MHHCWVYSPLLFHTFQMRMLRSDCLIMGTLPVSNPQQRLQQARPGSLWSDTCTCEHLYAHYHLNFYAHTMTHWGMAASSNYEAHLSKDIDSKEADQGKRCWPCLWSRPLLRVILCTVTRCSGSCQAMHSSGLLCQHNLMTLPQRNVSASVTGIAARGITLVSGHKVGAARSSGS